MSLSLKIHVAAGMLQSRVVGGERERGSERFEFTVGDVPGDTNGPFKQLEEMGDEDNSGYVALNEECMKKIKHMFEVERTTQGYFRLLQIRRFPRGIFNNTAEAKNALASLPRGVDGETLRRMACFLPTAVQTQWSPTMRCTMVWVLLRTVRVQNYTAPNAAPHKITTFADPEFKYTLCEWINTFPPPKTIHPFVYTPFETGARMKRPHDVVSLRRGVAFDD